MTGNTDNTVLDGRYRLLRRLGSGGMATVWAAHDERLGREVAVKLLSDVLAEDDRYRRRFEREARVAAGLSHPGLVGVLDFGIGSERPYLVMELVRGETLAARIATGGLGLDVLALAVELLDALAYMHRMHVVHRDVKPSNVLIGDDGRARLTDFGIARPENATELTETGQLLGTLAYMAPELRRGEPATPRSDLYSLGVLLRECGGERNPALAALIPRLTASESSRRPDSAEDARAVLTQTAPTLREPATETSATAPTAVLPGAREAPRRRVDPRRRGGALALLATVATAIAVVVAIALGDGSGGQGSNSPPAATEPRTSTGGAEAEPAPTPAQDEGRAETAVPVSCPALEKKKTALEEEKKAAEESAGDDHEAKKAIKARFEARKKALEERAKECE